MRVTHIMGEPLRFWVESESTDSQHLVDLGEHACGCASWTCNNRRYKQQNGHNYTCKHISAARNSFLDDVIEAMKEHALSR